MDNILGLKIDVDTYMGMKRGVPRLLSILEEFGIKGTFYLSFGPDASGRALLQLVKNPRFLKKMMRTNAGSLYGWRTAFYGMLLPSPMIALSFPSLVRTIIAAGHEVEFHAWDHRRWQDELPTRSYAWIEQWFQQGIDAYRQLVGTRPRSFGAPAWLIDDRVLEIARNYNFEYLSCTRAPSLFIHAPLDVMEIPSDLPCFEEIGVEHGVAAIQALLERGGVHVLPVHAEAEGGIWDVYFIELLQVICRLDYRILPLGEIRKHAAALPLPTRKYQMALLPGRSAVCAV